MTYKYFRSEAINLLRPNNKGYVYRGDNETLRWGKKNTDEAPTFEEIDLKARELQAAYPLQELREKRNVLLAETDWMANKDVTLPAAWKTYRQELRDLPSGLDTVDKVNAVTWPTKPS